MVVAWAVSKLHHFRVYWHAHSKKWNAASLLLQSDVCTMANIRMELGEFDNCEEAMLYTQINPFGRAVYSLAEELHVCGNDRCAILYMDITDRLPYIFALTVSLSILILYKCAKDYRYQALYSQCMKMQLPHHKSD